MKLPNDTQEHLRLSVYGEPPTQADISPDHPGAPLFRVMLRWRLMNRGERRRILGHG